METPTLLQLSRAVVFVAAAAAATATLSLRRKRGRMQIEENARAADARQRIIEGGPEALKILMDFDRTITTYWGPSGRRGASCHGILEAITDAAAQARADALNRYYWPIETSSTLSRAEKIPHMEAWYAAINDLLVEARLTRDDVVRAVAAADVQLREGVREIIDLTAAHGIPLIVFSAGIGDVLREVLLQKYGPLPPNVRIVSNWMVWDADGRVAGWSKPLIHMFNKDSSHLARTRLFSSLSLRPHVVLVGDGLGDETMAEGMQARVVIKFGLINDVAQADALRPLYTSAFDVVLLDDPPLSPVLTLLTGVCANANRQARTDEAQPNAAAVAAFTGIDTPAAGVSATPVL